MTGISVKYKAIQSKAESICRNPRLPELPKIFKHRLNQEYVKERQTVCVQQVVTRCEREIDSHLWAMLQDQVQGLMSKDLCTCLTHTPPPLPF